MGIKAIPHKSARESDERFFVRKSVKPQEYFVYFKVFGRISGGKDLGDPAKAQRQRVWWGKEEQRSD